MTMHVLQRRNSKIRCPVPDCYYTHKSADLVRQHMRDFVRRKHQDHLCVDPVAAWYTEAEWRCLFRRVRLGESVRLKYYTTEQLQEFVKTAGFSTEPPVSMQFRKTYAAYGCRQECT